MATSASTAGIGSTDGESRVPLLRRARRNVPHWVWYTLAAFGFALLVLVAQLALYMQRREPRDARIIVDRELRMNVLRPGERVVRSVSVFRRKGVDYFRATRGVLVLTDRRLVYLGAPPRDVTGPTGAPPVFEQREFRFDTLVHVKPSFAVLGMSRALEVDTQDGDLELAISEGGWPQAQLLGTAWRSRQERLQAIGAWGERVRQARTELKRILTEYHKQPVYHVVRPGDAVSSIASWYEIPVERLRQQNGIQGNTIKVGQRLLVKSGS
jgi:hypothetical protein